MKELKFSSNTISSLSCNITDFSAPFLTFLFILILLKNYENIEKVEIIYLFIKK